MIKLFKLTNYKKKVWGNRYLFLNYDSFQSMWIMYNWIVDWEEFNLIRDIVKKNDCCLDVGSNMGFYTIWFSKFTNKILSFEPDQNNFRRLNKNIQINGLDKAITSINIALGDEERLVSFTNHLDGENHISLSGNGELAQVKCRKLKNVLDEYGIHHIKYIKMDVEGFELSVLKGMTDLLEEKKVDIIQIEINKSVGNSGGTIPVLLEFIEKHQYILCSYDIYSREIKRVTYQPGRENYFLTHNLESVNNLLRPN